MKKPEKRTLRNDCRLILRAIRIWNEIMPYFWFWQIARSLFETIMPYFGLSMSALMVNELAEDCDVRKLFCYASVTVAGTFAVSVLKKAAQSKCYLKDYKMSQQHEAFFFHAQNGMQYEHLENPDVVLMRGKIMVSWQTSGAGLPRIQWAIQAIPVHVLNIVFSASLTVSMFTVPANGKITGGFAFLGSPALAAAMIALIAVNTVLSVKISVKSAAKTGEALSELARLNTFHNAYGRIWGADVVVFGFHRIVMDVYHKYLLRPEWIGKMEKIQVRYGILSILLNAVLDIAVFLFVAAKAFVGVFGIGNFLLYQGTIRRFVSAVSGLASEVGRLRYNNRYLEEVYDFLDLPNDMYKGTLAVEKRDDNDYEIEFCDVSFRYPRTENWVLRHVSLKFRIGDRLAVVGENGSGKTTFIKLLCRLYDPTEGRILLNGIDITRYRYDEYMELFSVVFQDFTLFSFSLGENVAADCTYDSAKVRDCLMRAGLGEKLASLGNDPQTEKKDALEYAIGREYDRNGVDFSGGEMQKIALARALCKDAPFVILDEPTAALDPVAEAAVYENFNVLVKEKTAVFISHRLSSCRFCDCIAVFDHGQIVQHGPHKELVLDERGKYHELWHAQAQYYTHSTS